jgi:hypothetical protein
LLDHFKGSETLGALEALTTAADAVPFLNGTGVDDLEVGIAAGRAFHE